MSACFGVLEAFASGNELHGASTGLAIPVALTVANAFEFGSSIFVLIEALTGAKALGVESARLGDPESFSPEKLLVGETEGLATPFSALLDKGLSPALAPIGDAVEAAGSSRRFVIVGIGGTTSELNFGAVVPNLRGLFRWIESVWCERFLTGPDGVSLFSASEPNWKIELLRFRRLVGCSGSSIGVTALSGGLPCGVMEGDWRT
jgi:hypothetical protein